MKEWEYQRGSELLKGTESENVLAGCYFPLKRMKEAIAAGICDRTKDEEAETFKPTFLCWQEGEETRKHFPLYR